MGPTAAGKSEFASAVARRFEGEIVSADSRQIYRGMDIGTDKGARRHGIPHYLIDIRRPDQRYSVADFRDDARQCIERIIRRGHLPIVVGGTGFYIRVLTGDRPLPNIPPDPRFRAWADNQPLEALAAELQATAPALFAGVDNLRHKRRVIRALERARGHEGEKPIQPLPYRTLKLALIPPLEILRPRIERRVEDLLRRGFLTEVAHLVRRYGGCAPGLAAVGYRQVLPYLRGAATLAETRAAIVAAHWRYARRQLTWLRREPRLVVASSPEEAHAAVRSFLET